MSPTQAPALTAWLDDFFAEYYRRRPVNATFIGEHDHDHRLPDFSENGAGDYLAGVAGLLSRLDSLPPEPLSTIETIDRTLAADYLRTQTWELTSEHFHRGNPSFYTGEAVFGIIGLFLTDYAAFGERVSAAIDRMHAIPALLQQAKANVRRAPAAWTERAIREADGALALLGPQGLELLAHERAQAGERFDGAGLRAAADVAAAAFAEYRAYLSTDLIRRAGNGYAGGEEAFDLMMRHGHILDLSGDQIVAYAEDALADAAAFLDAHAADFSASSSAEALSHLANIRPTAGIYYASYTDIWRECRATAVRYDLVTWPEFPIEYVPRPQWTRAAAAYLDIPPYRTPAAVNRPPLHQYSVSPLDTSASFNDQIAFLRENNDSVIKLDHVIRYGGIGRHVQSWYAYHAASRIGRIAAVDCASRLALFCGGTLAEGWAGYIPSVMDEAGFLKPLESYAEVHSRRRMAARAIVDVKLHRGELSLDEAAAFYERAAAMSAGAARHEAVRNSMFPGTAMMGLVGADLIHDLRADLAAKQGEDFDLGRFHDRFLSYGSIPVSLIAADMRRG